MKEIIARQKHKTALDVVKAYERIVERLEAQGKQEEANKERAILEEMRAREKEALEEVKKASKESAEEWAKMLPKKKHKRIGKKWEVEEIICFNTEEVE